RLPAEALGVDARNQRLDGREDLIEPCGEHRRRQPYLFRQLDAEELGVALGVPAVHGATAVCDGRRPRRAERTQLFLGGRIAFGVDRVELDPPRREELLRLGAGRSAGPVEDLRASGRHDVLRCQRPWNVGVFLFANAVTPSRKSAVWPLAAMACASSSICVSRLSHVDWWKSRLAPPNASVGPAASSRASPSTCDRSSASGTTRVMRP